MKEKQFDVVHVFPLINTVNLAAGGSKLGYWWCWEGGEGWCWVDRREVNGSGWWCSWMGALKAGKMGGAGSCGSAGGAGVWVELSRSCGVRIVCGRPTAAGTAAPLLCVYSSSGMCSASGGGGRIHIHSQVWKCNLSIR